MPVVKPGSDWDTHGCISSAGYTWCDILNRCVRLWMEVCEIPSNCLTWNDGCNHCEVRDGKLSLCTEMYCFTMGTPQCEVFAPDIMPLPAIDRDWETITRNLTYFHP